MPATVDLRTALGRAAWTVWEGLQIEAAEDGTVVAKREDLASAFGVSIRSLTRAMARLEDAGLVRRGRQCQTSGRWQIYPPKPDDVDVFAWAKTHKPDSHGGVRSTSGRPSGGPNAQPEVGPPGQVGQEKVAHLSENTPNNQDGPPESGPPEEQDGPPEQCVNNQDGPPDRLTPEEVKALMDSYENQDGLRDASSRSLDHLTPFTHRYSSSIYSFGNARPSARVGFSVLPEKAEAAPLNPISAVFAAMNATKVPVDPNRRFGTLQQLADAGLIPGYPGKHLPMNWFPKARLLPEDQDGAADADALWGAFQSVARFRGARAFAGGWNRRDRAAGNRGAPIEKLTSLPEAALRLAACAMRDREIEPVAWVWWSWDAWEKGMAARGGKLRKGAPPPLRWLFSEQRLHERSGWFRGETNKFRIMRNAPWPRAVRDHWQRYQNLLDVVRTAHPEDDLLRVRAEVRRAFPDGYERHLARAQKALAEQAQEIREAVASGTFLW